MDRNYFEQAVVEKRGLIDTEIFRRGEERRLRDAAIAEEARRQLRRRSNQSVIAEHVRDCAKVVASNLEPGTHTIKAKVRDTLASNLLNLVGIPSPNKNIWLLRYSHKETPVKVRFNGFWVPEHIHQGIGLAPDGSLYRSVAKGTQYSEVDEIDWSLYRAENEDLVPYEDVPEEIADFSEVKPLTYWQHDLLNLLQVPAPEFTD